MIKFACLLCLMIKGLSMRLIASSSEMESIKINGTQPLIYSEKYQLVDFNLSFGEPFAICHSKDVVPLDEVFLLEHLFGIDCYFPLQIYFVVDGVATIYMNGEQVCTKGGHRTLNNCSISSESVVGDGCGQRNLTVVVKNIGVKPNPSFVAYQLVQTDSTICHHSCPKPLTWYSFPVCSCECGYTSLCGPGISWNGYYSTYRYTHLLQPA